MAHTDKTPSSDPSPERDFDFVFASERRRLYRLAYSVLRDRHAAVDVVRATMFDAWRRWNGRRDPVKRSTSLSQICLRQCFRHQPQRGTEPISQLGTAFEDLGSKYFTSGADRRVRPTDRQFVVDGASASRWRDRQGARRRWGALGASAESAWGRSPQGARALGTGEQPSDLDLDAAYKSLSLEQRAAVLLHFHYGFTIDECGKVMGCRSGTVSTHVSRALARLRSELADG
ncbi:MAG: hypothetical protein HYX32_11830 [Actinobacteria bacterium]|nr:hypothetical protein [Actinomycetota bacterium]